VITKVPTIESKSRRFKQASRRAARRREGLAKDYLTLFSL
jgi:hypothetical protein